MNTNNVVQTAALTTGNVNHSLREGSSVFVRVLKNLGSNSFRVAFAGRQLNISSQLELKEGTAFLAKIKLDGGKILLQKVEQSFSQANILEKITAQTGQDGKIVNPALINYFKKLGLEPDNINLGLFQQMRQLGISFNSSNFEKIKHLAEKFKGKEAEAAQIAMILEQKGLTADFESIWAILDESYNEEFLNKFEHELETDYSIEDVFKDFFRDIFSGKNYSKNKPGILTLFNHCGFKYGKQSCCGSWIKIPFEFSYKKNELNNYGHGSLNSFVEKEGKKIQKSILNFNFCLTNYYFVIYYTDNKCTKISTCIKGIDDKEKNAFLENMKKGFSEIAIEALDEQDVFSFYPEQNEILSFKGSV